MATTVKKTLYVEGTSDLDNGNLRKAFATLLEKELRGVMPQIIMGDGITQTVDKFISKPLMKNEQRFLLIDSDRPLTEEARDEIIANFNSNKKPHHKHSLTKDNTFFMVQEAEAWILSQPAVLEQINVSAKSLGARNVMEIQKPSERLAELYKKSGKHYHKVSEFAKVFPKLNTGELKKYFNEFERLIHALS